LEKKGKYPTTDIEILDHTNPTENRILLTNKEEIEHAIMARNQKHSRQALNTHFSKIPELAEAINLNNPNNKIEAILKGEFLHTLPDNIDLTPAERQWITDLQQQVDEEIETRISTHEFINFFKHRREKTSSSYSG
jgi:hypothetical protein